jgi:hypothetical protein
MRIGVIADGMLLQCRDDVGAVTSLERARLLTDDLECRLNTLLGEERRQPFGRVIALRQDVVFGVEPKDDIDLAECRPLADSIHTDQSERQQHANDAREVGQSFHLRLITMTGVRPLCVARGRREGTCWPGQKSQK